MACTIKHYANDVCCALISTAQIWTWPLDGTHKAGGLLARACVLLRVKLFKPRSHVGE